MKGPELSKNGEIDLKSVEALSRDELAHWVKERLHRADWTIPGGGQGAEIPHYLFALLYPKLGRFTREDLQNVVIEFLEDLTSNPQSEWLNESGNELLMLVDPILVESARREDAIDLLLTLAGLDHVKSELWPNLHFRALQGLIALRYRAPVDFWRRQSIAIRYTPVILEGLALVDVSAPFKWLTEVEWNNTVEDAILGLLPTLLDTYETAKVVTCIEHALPQLQPSAVSSLLAFCDEEGLMISPISALRHSEQESDAVTVAARTNWEWHDFRLVTVKRQKKITNIETPAIIGSRSAISYFPLSFAQQRFWFLDQLQGGSPFYNLHNTWRAKGPLDLTFLEASLRELVGRHETLRTTFQEVDGNPMQVISPDTSCALDLIDLTDLSGLDQEQELMKIARQKAQYPFDLKQGPLFRLLVIRLGETEHIISLTMHHTISDEWSMSIFIGELSAIYRAFVAGEPSPLPALSFQYADFCRWQRELLSGDNLEKQLDYWRLQLAEAPTVSTFPAIRRRPPIRGFEGAEYHLTLPKKLMDNLRELSRDVGVTLFISLLAAFKILLFRYTGQEDIVIGVPVSNRTRLEVEPLIGCFVNTLALRTNVGGDLTVGELLSRVREVCLDAFAHQDVPFEKIVEELRPQRDLTHTPVFQTMLVPGVVSSITLDLIGLSITPIRIPGQTAQFDLTLIMTEEEQGTTCIFEYDTDLFNETAIKRIAHNFQHLLSAMVSQPSSTISSLVLLTEAEREQVVVGWNNTKAAAPTYCSIAHWFAEQAERTPNAIALAYEHERLTYRELNQRANQLAQRLLRMGVRPEMLVGVSLERSVEQIIAVLGVLKSGAAYVPLDPYYPQERLDYILHDSQVAIVLTANDSLDRFNSCGAQTICVDTEWPPISNESTDNPPDDLHLTADNSAYVIYTSGSTGAPKGVLVTHANLIHSTAARVDYYRDPVKSFLLLSSLEFDSSVAGIFWTLCTGGTLVLPHKNYWEEPQHFTEPIVRHKISHILTLPSLYRFLLDEAESSKLSSLRTVIVAGEVCPLELIEYHRARNSQALLFNEYGPTEATVWSTVYNCSSASPSLASIPIGRPVSNTQIYLLDVRMNVVPIGAVGELYIGGAGVARGYLDRLALTGATFIPNPFSVEPGARLYKTGDLARFLFEGNIEFLGRLDDQLKIRGFRIEIGEVEAVLRSHKSIQEAIILARNDIPGGPQLVAYLVLNQITIAPLVSELRNYLAQRLPNYMVPSIFVRLTELPLTPNGKVDRRALPIPNEVTSRWQGSPVPPRTPIEEVVADIWADVLGISLVGRTDNFFELGGHSLLATQVVSRIRQVFQIELPLKTFFEFPTVSEIATVIAYRQGVSGRENDLPPYIRQAASSDELKGN